MNAREQTGLANRLLTLIPGQSSPIVDNGCWKFVVHRYEDSWVCLWDDSVFDKHQGKLGRDLGREFHDAVDFVNFILGHALPEYVLEAQDFQP